MDQFSREPKGLSFLLVSGDAGWTAAVQDASADLGVEQIEITRSAAHAVSLLAAYNRPYSHLLLQRHTAGDLLPALIGLTAGDARSGIAVIVLGSGEDLSPRLTSMQVRLVRDMNGPALRALLGSVNPGRSDPTALSEPELREALADARIQARYQPVVRVTDDRLIGLEVLARLEHPEHGIIPPDLFVPRMEAAGMSWSLTQLVARRAFDDWRIHAFDRFGLWIALNFPLDVLLIPEALELLETQRVEADIPASSIVIELTESRPVEDLPRLRRAIAWLRDRGYGVAIDDVGPEMRDPRELMNMRFTALKLDKGLARQLQDSPEIQDFLTSTVDAAHLANMSVVAEGVESAEVWNRVAALGVDEVQGFLVARPLPVEALEPWYQGWCRARGL